MAQHGGVSITLRHHYQLVLLPVLQKIVVIESKSDLPFIAECKRQHKKDQSTTIKQHRIPKSA